MIVEKSNTNYAAIYKEQRGKLGRDVMSRHGLIAVHTEMPPLLCAPITPERFKKDCETGVVTRDQTPLAKIAASFYEQFGPRPDNNLTAEAVKSAFNTFSSLIQKSPAPEDAPSYSELKMG